MPEPAPDVRSRLATWPPERVLVVLHGAIGDVVRAMPLVDALKRAWPGSHLAWSVEPLCAPLVERHRAVDRVHVFDRRRGLGAAGPFLRELRSRRFDLVIDLQRHLKSGIVSRATGAPVRLGFPRENGREGNWWFQTHTVTPRPHFSNKVEQFLAFAEPLGVPVDRPLSFGLEPGAPARRRAAELLDGAPRPFVAAFLGSTWESRIDFPEKTAAVLAEASARRGLGAVLLGGPADVELARAVEAASPGPVRNLVGETSLLESAAVFAEAAVAYGPDSGPMHLAAAMGCRVVSLWGATSPLRSAPAGSEDLVLVGEAGCVPCYRRRCPIERLCLQRIEPAEILSRIERALDSKGADSRA